MAVTVLLELQAKQGTGDELVATFKQLLPDTRKREGFLEAVLHQNQDDKDNLVIVENWQSKALYESYLGWRQETGVIDQLVAACSAPPSIRYFDVTEA